MRCFNSLIIFCTAEATDVLGFSGFVLFIFHIQQMSEYWTRAISGFDVVYHHKAMLCGWICGPEAKYMESLSEMQVGKSCTHLLRFFVGNHVPNPKKVYR